MVTFQRFHTSISACETCTHARTKYFGSGKQLHASTSVPYLHCYHRLPFFFCGIGSDQLRIDRHLHVCARSIATFGKARARNKLACTFDLDCCRAAVHAPALCLRSGSGARPMPRPKMPCTRGCHSRRRRRLDAHRGAAGSQGNELNATTSLESRSSRRSTFDNAHARLAE